MGDQQSGQNRACGGARNRTMHAGSPSAGYLAAVQRQRMDHSHRVFARQRSSALRARLILTLSCRRLQAPKTVGGLEPSAINARALS